MSPSRYTIAERTFSWPEELAWGQLRWIRRTLKEYAMTELTEAQLVEVLAEHLPALLAAVLVEEGQTPAAKVQAGDEAYAQLEQWLAGHLTSKDAVRILSDFFASGRMAGMVGDLMGDLGRMLRDVTGSKMPSAS